MNNTGTTKETEMALKLQIQVRGCTDEQYIEAATKCLALSGYAGLVWQVEHTRKGATVHFQSCVAIVGQPLVPSAE